MRTTKGNALCSGALTFVVPLLLASFGAPVEAEPSKLFGVQLSENYEAYDIDPTTVVEDGYGLDPFYRVDVVPPERNPGFEYYTLTFDSETKKVEEVQAGWSAPTEVVHQLGYDDPTFWRTRRWLESERSRKTLF
jgi:hypothetical protein